MAAKRAASLTLPKDEEVDRIDLQRVESIKATGIEMMELARGRCRQLTSEGKLDEALSESEECGYWWDRATGRG